MLRHPHNSPPAQCSVAGRCVRGRTRCCALGFAPLWWGRFSRTCWCSSCWPWQWTSYRAQNDGGMIVRKDKKRSANLSSIEFTRSVKNTWTFQNTWGSKGARVAEWWAVREWLRSAHWESARWFSALHDAPDSCTSVACKLWTPKPSSHFAGILISREKTITEGKFSHY